MTTVSPSSLNKYVADKVVLNSVILTSGYLDQMEVLTFIRILNLISFLESLGSLENDKANIYVFRVGNVTS